MFIADSQEPKKHKQSKCLSVDKGTSTWYIHVMKCYSAVKRGGTLAQATTWMILEYIVLTGNKSGTKGEILHSSTYMRLLEE